MTPAALRAAAATLAAALAVGQCAPAPPPTPPPFTVVEATIPEMQAAMAEGRVTSRQLVEQYLVRIGLYENDLNAAIAINANALAEADARDRERAAGQVRGPLHGIPLALKDNIHTTNMPTSGGTLRFKGYVPPYAATLTVNLEAAGAIIIAKTTLSELAGYMAGPGNYNGAVGHAFNPYDPRPDPRPDTFDGRGALTPAGSSSGSGTAANLWAASVGTETAGSILGPSNISMLAAVKPTVGRVSRWGVIPITADQDTAGPMARTVTDAVILFGAMEGASPDPNDPATTRCEPPPNRDYTPFLDAAALKGARIGIPRAFYYDPITLGGESRGGLNEAQRAAMAEAIEVLRAQGAEIVDPVDLPSVVDPNPDRHITQWSFCGSATEGRGGDADCTAVVKYGMKRDFNLWLDSLGETAPVKTLTELRAWNRANEKAGAMRYGQARLDISDEVDLERDRPRYEADRARDLELTTTRGIDAVMAEHNLDALLFPASSGAGFAARPGYPTVMSPFATVPNAPTPAFPDGFDAKPAPYGVSFTGLACSEPRLIGLAYAFEQATRRRVPPPAFP
ncbi:MAG: amidase family protein [Vicinamibacterales bacterium]|nr:amidase family protein [Vicinamibacterales bacterium]